MKILFTGGGTGGHIFPLVAIAREIRRIYPQKNLEFYYAGPKDELGAILLSQEDFVIKTISAGKIRRYFSWENFIDILFKIPLGFLQSFFLILSLRPDLVFSKGGSGSAPVVCCARLFGIPIFIHESDVVPGLSNQIASKWAKKIFVSFPKTEYFNPEKTALVGIPIRKELLEGDKNTAKELFNLTFKKPLIMFCGGSQGAEAINDFVLRVLNSLLKDYELLHITGRLNYKGIVLESAIVIDKNLEKYYHPAAFLDEEKMKHAYKAADFIISRAGASAIFEIAALGKPSILIPLPSSAADHQAKNAYAYALTGAGLVVEQDNLAPNFFLEKLWSILSSQEKLNKMKEAAFNFSKPMAAKAIAREILEFLTLE